MHDNLPGSLLLGIAILFSVASTGCSSNDKSQSKGTASGLNSSDETAGNGEIALTMPTLDNSADGAPDRVVISVTNSNAVQKSQKIDGPFAANASYKLSAPSGPSSVTVEVYAAGKLLFIGTTTVTVSAGGNVAATIGHGWVQSYGSRCVKPPVIFGDVERRYPMTVAWSKYAQSLT